MEFRSTYTALSGTNEAASKQKPSLEKTDHVIDISAVEGIRSDLQSPKPFKLQLPLPEAHDEESHQTGRAASPIGDNKHSSPAPSPRNRDIDLEAPSAPGSSPQLSTSPKEEKAANADQAWDLIRQFQANLKLIRRKERDRPSQEVLLQDLQEIRDFSPQEPKIIKALRDLARDSQLLFNRGEKSELYEKLLAAQQGFEQELLSLDPVLRSPGKQSVTDEKLAREYLDELNDRIKTRPIPSQEEIIRDVEKIRSIAPRTAAIFTALKELVTKACDLYDDESNRVDKEGRREYEWGFNQKTQKLEQYKIEGWLPKQQLAINKQTGQAEQRDIWEFGPDAHLNDRLRLEEGRLGTEIHLYTKLEKEPLAATSTSGPGFFASSSRAAAQAAVIPASQDAAVPVLGGSVPA